MTTVRIVPVALPDSVEMHDVRAAIQAAWMANEDGTAIEIGKRYDLFGQVCMCCAAWETRWTMCVPCARGEIKGLGGILLRKDRVRAFQQQWNLDNPSDQIAVDGIVGLATLVRGWRPYHTYGIG